MRLTQKAISLLQANPQLIRLMALALDFTETWIRELLRNEHKAKNSALTTVKAMQVFQQHTELKHSEVKSEVLQEVKQAPFKLRAVS